tara:strand:- start:117 stop:539 length:423 start_codon:yes stop_codon:yes gene_type:complete
LQEEEQKVEKKYLRNKFLKMIKFKSLNKSSQFLEILKKKKLHTKYFTVYFSKNLKNSKKEVKKYLNISFVMKKNIGSAVIRNKIKRKLRSAVQSISKQKNLIDLGFTYVVFGKNSTYKDKFSLILNEASVTFKKIKQMQG